MNKIDEAQQRLNDLAIWKEKQDAELTKVAGEMACYVEEFDYG
jgi:hypothetical protein